MVYKIIASLSSITILFIAFYFLGASSAATTKEKLLINSQKGNPDYEHWSISKLSDSLSQLKVNQLIFMEENSMKGTYLELNKGETLNRKAVTDEIYYLHSGACSVTLSKVDQAFDKGDVLYVKKGADLIIDNGDQPLQLVMVSMKLASNSKKPKWSHFSKPDIESSRNSEENEWNPFIMYSNVMFGMYMLPHEEDGDARLVHPWQELNIVTAGSSKFVMDTGAIDVEEGSIFFVAEGNGHYFDSLKEDIDILILWEQRNVSHEDH